MGLWSPSDHEYRILQEEAAQAHEQAKAREEVLTERAKARRLARQSLALGWATVEDTYAFLYGNLPALNVFVPVPTPAPKPPTTPGGQLSLFDPPPVAPAPPAPEPEPAKPEVCEICQQVIDGGSVSKENHTICTTCNLQIVDYEDRLQARLDRLQGYADKLTKEGQAAYQRAHQMADRIPFGQPILVGHHSEGRDRRYRDKIHNTFGRAFATLKKAADVQRKASHPSKAISSDNPAAVLELSDKLAKLEARQEAMTRINKIIQKVCKKPRVSKADREAEQAADRAAHRKPLAELNAYFTAKMDAERALVNSWMQYAPQVAEEAGITLEQAQRLLKPDFMNRVGYAAFELTNNGAEIRRVKARMGELIAKRQQQAENAETEPTSTKIGNVEIVEDVADNRIRLLFPGKPAAAVIAKLKSHGFRWSPTNMAWQRQLTYDARYWAKEIAASV